MDTNILLCELNVDAPEGSVALIHVPLKFPLAHFIAYHEVLQKKKAKQDRKKQNLSRCLLVSCEQDSALGE